MTLLLFRLSTILTSITSAASVLINGQLFELPGVYRFTHRNPDEQTSRCELLGCHGCDTCQSPAFLKILDSYRATESALRVLRHAQESQLSALRQTCAHFKRLDGQHRQGQANTQASYNRCVRCGIPLETIGFPSGEEPAVAEVEQVKRKRHSPESGPTEPCPPQETVPGKRQRTASTRESISPLPELDEQHGCSEGVDDFQFEGDAGLCWREIGWTQD